MTTINDLIHTNAHNAYQQGFEAGEKEGYKEATRDTFDEVNAILSDLYDYFYTHAGQREAICEAQAKVESLQEKLAAQLGYE